MSFLLTSRLVMPVLLQSKFFKAEAPLTFKVVSAVLFWQFKVVKAALLLTSRLLMPVLEQYNSVKLVLLLTFRLLMPVLLQSNFFKAEAPLTFKVVSAVLLWQYNFSNFLLLLTSKLVMPVLLQYKSFKLENFSMPLKSATSKGAEIVVTFAISSADNVSLPSGLIVIFSFIYFLNAASGKFVSLISTSPSAYGVGIAALDNGLFSIGAGIDSSSVFSSNVSTVTDSWTST